MLSSRLVIRVLCLWIGLCLLVVVLGHVLAAEHGLLRTITSANGQSATGRLAWPLVDGALPYWDRAYTIRFEGVLWQGAPGQATWRVVHNGGVEVRVNGQTVFAAAEKGPLTADEFPVIWSNDWLALEIEYRHDPAALEIDGGRLLMGVYEPAAWGWSLLPTYRLYTSAPDPALAAAEQTNYTLTTLALVGLAAGIAALGLVWARRTRFWRRRETWIVVALVGLALLVRFFVLSERAAHDRYFYALQVGSDNYVDMAQSLYSGTAGLGGTWRQLGGAIWFVGVMRLFGPDFEKLYAANIICGALSVGAVAGAAWLLAGRRAGLIAGLLAALFPPLVFYQTTLQPEAVATALMAFIALAGCWTVQRSSVRGAAVFGILTGLAGLVRPTGLLCGPAFCLALLVGRDRAAAWRGWRRVVGLTAVAGAFALLTISPQTLANYAVGQPNLLSGSGPVTLYRGNNRDADGTMNYRQAFEVNYVRGGNWTEAAIQDMRADPGRAAALMLHKLGLFWSNIEIANNVSFYGQGVRVSTLLGVLSLDGWLGASALALVGWAGVAWLLLEREQRGKATTWLLIGLIAAITLGTVAYILAGRLRALVLPLMCIPAGVALDRLIVAVQARRVDRNLLAAGGIALVFMLVMHAFEYQLPRKEFFYGDLPTGVMPRSDNLGGEIALVGVGPIESDYRPGGYVYVTLYWRAIAPPGDDYAAFVHVVGLDGQQITGKDIMLGGISYPDVGASDWPVGATLAESYLVRLPEDMPPVVELHAGLYHPATLTRLSLLAADGTPLDRNFVRLRALGVIPAEGLPALEGDSVAVDYRLGEALRLNAMQVPDVVAPGAPLTVGLEWEALQPVWEDYTAFFHLVDADRRLVAQSDGPALGAEWPTSALVPGHPVAAQRVIDVPADALPGDYVLLMGTYSYPSLDRLAARDGSGTVLPDGLIELATVRIE